MKLFKITLLMAVPICLISLYASEQQDNMHQNEEVVIVTELKTTTDLHEEIAVKTTSDVSADLSKSVDIVAPVQLSKQYDVQPEDMIIMMNIEEITPEIIPSKIQLFMYKGCSFCDKVTLFLEQHDLVDKVEFIEVELIDAEITEKRDLLKSISGRTQAPYLVDSDADVKMAESQDIIKYFIKKFKIELKLSNIDNTEVKHDAEKLLSNILLSPKPVVILVSTTWCPPCKVFKPIFTAIAKEMADQFEFVFVNGDANKNIVEQLGVRGYPTVVFYKDGQKIDVQYDRSKSGFAKALQTLL